MLALLSIFLLHLSNGEREIYKMDFNWKFHLGTTNIMNNCSSSFYDMTNIQCYGLTNVTQYASTFNDCENYCCGLPSCETFQYCPGGSAKCGAKSCWIGAKNTCVNSDGWQSMGRNGINPNDFPVISVNFSENEFYNVNIPHDYVVNGTFSPENEESHGYLPKNYSWYRKHFSLPNSAKGQSIWIYFEGIYRNSDIWLNGIFLGNHQSGYTSFRYYISWLNILNYGTNSDNVLAIFVDPTHDEGWWYEGGGIYRHVWLTTTNSVHIKPWGLYLPSTIDTVNNDNKTGSGYVILNTTILNNGTNDVSGLTCVFTILKPDNTILDTVKQSNINVKANNNEINFGIKYNLNNILLWDINSPNLYTFNVTLLDSNGIILDNVIEKTGFRQFSFDSKIGFTLNKQNIKWKGFCNHQDFAGVGVGVPDRVNQFKVSHLKNMGANAWRMSHNPPNPELLDFMDEIGFLVWDENRNFAENQQYYDDMTDMILRDRNHPSIFIWSLCNEGGCMENNANSGTVTKIFEQIIRDNDGNQRPISAAMNGGWGDGMSPLLSIQGVNYNYNELITYHNANPDQPIVSSESCSCTTDRGIYESSSTTGHVSAYTNCVSECWQPIINNKFVIGSFDWTGFDYKGEPTPYPWPDINSHFGINDIAGFPKDDYYYYRANFMLNEPLIHIVPNNWNYNTTNNSIEYLNILQCGTTQINTQSFTYNSNTKQIIYNNKYCVVATGNSDPMKLEICDTSLKSQQFTYNSNKQFVSTYNTCIDVYGETGPNIDEYGCKNGNDIGNQQFIIDNNNNSIISVYPVNYCLTSASDEAKNIWIYSNCVGNIELLLNGISLGKQQSIPENIIKFNGVNYQPGTLTAKCVDNNGNTHENSVATTGIATNIEMFIEYSGKYSNGTQYIIGDGQDVALIQLTVNDNNGKIVPDANNLIQFSIVSGPGYILGTGNGDPACHQPDHGSLRNAFMGKARVIVQSYLNKAGTIVLQATSNGLKSKTININVVLPQTTTKLL